MVLGLLLRGGAGLAGRSAGTMMRHPFITGTVAHVATDGKSTDMALNLAGKTLGNPLEQDSLSRGLLERLGIPSDMLDMGSGLGDGMKHLKEMMGKFLDQIGPLLNTLLAFIIEAMGGLMESMGVAPAHGTALAPNTSGSPQAIVQGSGRLAADLAAGAAGLDAATPEGRAALNMGEIFRVPHDGSTDIIKSPVGDLTSAARADRDVAMAPAAPSSALGNRGLNMDDVTF